jgi:uncharacterized protein involved in copper resistance
MKSFTFAAIAASLLLGVCVFVTGCGSGTGGGEKMGMSDGKMSAMDKMADTKMSDGKMDDTKMDKMSDGKMADGKMGNDKMSDGKMAGK